MGRPKKIRPAGVEDWRTRIVALPAGIRVAVQMIAPKLGTSHGELLSRYITIGARKDAKRLKIPI